MVMKASVSERTSAMPIGSGETREGGAKPRMCLYQNIDHCGDRELRPALRPLLERKNAQHDERAVEKQQEQRDIDARERA